MTTPEGKQEWEKEFENSMCRYANSVMDALGVIPVGSITPNDKEVSRVVLGFTDELTSFIRSLLQSREKDVLEDVIRIANEVAVEMATKYAEEKDWRQPYASNRIRHVGWEIQNRLKALTSK